MSSKSKRAWLALSTCALTVLACGGANAATATDATGAGTVAGSGAEGTDVSELIVTAERSQGAAAAPTKASIDSFQPQSIISRSFIENFTRENGDYTTIVLIAPSVAGISGDGGGFGDSNKVSLRGFHDGQYNVTYDALAFGDTNDPTHHPNDYFPPSMIGAAVVDRGPGAAGDLGQANYGGAIHLFSPTVSDTYGITQKLSYGSWNTRESVTSIQSGVLPKLGGAKILAIFDARASDSELSNTGGYAYNGLLKIIVPIGPRGTVTLFSTVETEKFYQSDATPPPGLTWQQLLLYGKNFALTNDPTSEFCKCYNDEKKNTDFEYIDFKYDFGSGITAQDQAYTYFYSNKTISADDLTGIIGGPNTSHPKDKAYNQADIGGYNKGNRYRVYGDIVRVNKDWTFGTLKAGALVEYSSTDRHNVLYDLTTGAPDFNPKYKSLAPTNAKTIETSSWLQYQLFVDFEIHPIANLTLTPGFKYLNFERKVDGTVENSLQGAQTRGAIMGTNTYTSPLYFFTGNYKITPYWSVYAQYATGFLVPSLSALYADQLSLNNLKPSKTINYQAGTVFSRGRFTADADVYKIDVSDLEIPSPNGQFFINAGNATYSGVEGEAAFAFPFGLTLFANGSLNAAKDTTHDLTELNAPKWTDAVGALYDYHHWQASLTWKEVGRQVAYVNGGAPAVTPQGVPLAANQEFEIPAYSTINATIAYDFGLIKMKLGVFNLADHRSVTSVTGPTFNGDFYTFQSGREILGTIEARLR